MSGIVALAACGLLAPEEEAPCDPVGTLTTDHIVDRTALTVEPSFCEMTTPFRRHIFTTTWTGSLAAVTDTYGVSWTTPPDAEVEADYGSGIMLRMGYEDGEVCASHFNACTAAGPPVCRPLRVVKNNVWTATPDFPIGAGGALAQNEDAVWWVNPVDATGYGVWRFDKASLRWSQVSDSFPEGDASAYDFQGGAAVVYDDHIHYIADNVLFLFDVRTQTWSRSKTLPHGLRRERTPLVYDDKLWVKTPGMFWVYDPTTQEQRYISELGDLADGIAFEVNGRLVFGAGRNLYADWRQPASWNRYFVAWDPVTEESEDYVLELPELHFTQALDLGETTIFLTNDGPNFVLDEASGAVSELNVNPTLACIQPSSGERHGAWKGAALAFDGVGLVVGGEFDTGLGVLQKRGAMLYFP